MRKSKKQLLRTMMACGLVVSVAAGGTVAYLTDAETATNTFTVGKVKIDLEEPGYPGNDSDEVKNIIPNQEIVKDPQIENTGNNDALVFLRVEVPQEEFTELDADNNVGEKKQQDLFKLKNVSDQWELLRTETTTDADGKVKTSYVYGYKKTLAKGSTTDKLFQKVQMKNSIEKDLEGNVEDVIVTACAIQATDIPDVDLTPGSDGTLGKDVLDQVYEIFLNQSGDQKSRPADDGDRNQTGKLGTISYELDGGTLADGSLTEYGSADYGYTPPEPTKEGYTFAGWEPQSIPAGSTGNVTLTAKWNSTVLGNISYNLDGGSMDEGKSSYTAEDYGYIPPTPTKKGCDFKGWSPASIPEDSTGSITFTAQWEERETILRSGAVINAQLKELAGNSEAKYTTEDAAITAIQRTDETPTEAVMADANSLISTSTSGKPIYAWFDNGTIKWWSEAKEIHAGTWLSYLCYNMTNLSDISGLADWSTDNVTQMNSTFAECANLADLTPIAGWNTDKVVNMDNTFRYCKKLTGLTSLANWNTENVASMICTFNGCQSLTDLTGLEKWDTSNVTTMSGLFFTFVNGSSLTDLTPLADWNTEKVTDMSDMFYNCEKLTDLSPLAKWNTGNVKDMMGMFVNCPGITNVTALADWDTGCVTRMRGVFDTCTGLTDLTGLANWDTRSVTDMSDMFDGCTSLTNLTGLANWDVSSVVNMKQMFIECKKLANSSALNDWNIANVTDFTSMFNNCPSHPTFTKREGTWSLGTFTPTVLMGSISYDLNGGTLSDSASANLKTSYTNVDYGYVPSASPTKEHYTFTGWSPASIPSKSSGDITFKAQWTAKVLGHITYNLDGGSFSTGDNAKYQYTAEDYGYNPPIPTKRGYSFAYWALTSDAGSQAIPDGTEGDLEFTAYWYVDSFAALGGISYELNDGYFESEPLYSYSMNDNGYIPPTPIRKGYTFSYWDPSSLYVDMNSPESNPEQVTFTAYWEPTTYWINYELDGGSFDSEEPKYSYTVEDNEYYTPPTPTKEGYTFTGWTITGNNTPLYSADSLWISSNAEYLDDVTFTANWFLEDQEYPEYSMINQTIRKLKAAVTSLFTGK